MRSERHFGTRMSLAAEDVQVLGDPLSGDFRKLQSCMDQLLPGQTAIKDRLVQIEECLGAVGVLSDSLAALQAAHEDCICRITALEKEVTKLSEVERPAHRDNFEPGERWEEVRRITRAEIDVEARRNNAVLSGLAEDEGENLEAVVKASLPAIADEVLLAKRLGKPRSWSYERSPAYWYYKFK